MLFGEGFVEGTMSTWPVRIRVIGMWQLEPPLEWSFQQFLSGMTHQPESSCLFSQSTMLNTDALQEFVLDAIQKALHGDGLISHVCTGGLIEKWGACHKIRRPFVAMLLICVIRLRKNLFLFIIHHGHHTVLPKPVISIAAWALTSLFSSCRKM